MRASHGAQVLRDAPILRRFGGSPMTEAVCTLLGPVVDWFTDQPSNPAGTIMGLIVAPIVVIIFLPVFLALMPMLILALATGAASASSAMVPLKPESTPRENRLSEDLPVLERRAA
jgi:hypothetical protein